MTPSTYGTVLKMPSGASAWSCGGDGGYDARAAFMFPKSPGVAPPVAARVNSNSRAKGRPRARAAPDHAGGAGGHTSRELARMAK